MVLAGGKGEGKVGGREKKVFITCVFHPSEIECSTCEDRRNRGDWVLRNCT